MPPESTHACMHKDTLKTLASDFQTVETDTRTTFLLYKILYRRADAQIFWEDCFLPLLDSSPLFAVGVTHGSTLTVSLAKGLLGGMGCCPSKPSAAEQAIGEIEERERAMSESNIGEVYVNPLLAQKRAAKTKSTENGGSIVLNTAFRHNTGSNGEPESSGDAIDSSALRTEIAQLKAQLAESSRNSSREASTAAAEIAQLKAQLAEAERTTIIDAAPAAQYHMAAATPVPGHAESQSSSG